MGHVDPNTFTPQQLSVEKLIKDQNFNWKVTGLTLSIGVSSGLGLAWLGLA